MPVMVDSIKEPEVHWAMRKILLWMWSYERGNYFSRSGFTVRLTRSPMSSFHWKRGLCLPSHQSNALFISVHFNYGGRADAEGIETYCLAPRGVPFNQ